LIFPLGAGLASLGLILTPGLSTASLGQLARTTLRTTFRNPIDNLLYNAVPLRVKGRARAFIGGAVVPVGEFIGGLLLLILQGVVQLPAWFFPAALAALALGYLVSAWGVRRQYTRALIEMLEGQDFSFLLGHGATTLSVADPATLHLLQERLEQPDNAPEFAVFMAQLIAQVGGSQAVSVLNAYIRRADNAYVRASMVDVLVAAEVDDGQVRQLYADLLTDPDVRVRRSAFGGLERLSGVRGAHSVRGAHGVRDAYEARFKSLALAQLDDPDLEMRVRALTALARTGNFYGFPSALDALDALLQSDKADQRAQGVRVLRLLCDLGSHLRTVDQLLDYLSDQADEVRLQAVLAVERLVVKSPEAVTADAVAHLITDPVERIRQAATVILGAIGSPQAHQVMLTALNDPAREVRACAADELTRVGPAVLSVLYPLLNANDPHLVKMAAFVLCRVNPRQYASLLQGHIEQTLVDVYRACAQLAALEGQGDIDSLHALRSALAEQNEWLLDEVFDLLGALHKDADVRVVQSSLRNDDAHVRANAAEALEALTSPQMARLIAPLADPEVVLSDRVALGREVWNIELLNARQVFDALVTQPGPVSLRSIAVFALGEIAAMMIPSKPLSRRARRGRSADALLGMLMDAPPPDPESPADRSPLQPKPSAIDLDLAEIEMWIHKARADAAPPVRGAALAARQMMDGRSVIERAREEGFVLSTIERMMALKKVPFFQNMTIEQLTVVANVCEETLVDEETHIFEQDDPGGALYVIVSGRVAIEREGRRRGSTVRLAEMEANSYFGEMSLFDGGPRSAAAVALQDTLLLCLRREPLLALLRRYPDLSLELIDVLSQRLRDADDRIAELSQSRPRELQKLYDKLNFE
ncbi:MAG: HEAT repeat domain-containing protein, partial [Anaerolineae bacterium]|nr:HEAT repeat domain-containing protein [Anaerolineae bacterium]